MAFQASTLFNMSKGRLQILICGRHEAQVNSFCMVVNSHQTTKIRVAAALVATQLLLQPLTVSPTIAQPFQNDNAKMPMEQTSTVEQTGKSNQELMDQSRRNTRLSGRASQQFSLARRSAQNGDLDGALVAYEELIKMAPTFAPAYSNRANILVARNRLSEAVRDYDHALDLAPLDGDTWVVYVNRGVTRLALGVDPNVALEDLNLAYDRKGADPLVLQNRAAVYEALGKWESAIRDYQGALKGNEVKPFWLRYALVLFQKGKSVESLAILKRIANSFSVDDVRAAMAVVYFDRGDIGSAETQWSAMERPRLFESRKFLVLRNWPPRAIEGMAHFRSLTE